MYATKYNKGNQINITFGESLSSTESEPVMSDGYEEFTEESEREDGTFFGWTFAELKDVPDGKIVVPKPGWAYPDA